MAVLCENEYALRVVGGEDARHIAIGIYREFHGAYDVALDVVALDCDSSILRTSNGVLVCVLAGIVGILAVLRCEALVQRERELGYGGLVVAYPCEHGAVGIEAEGAAETEFLLVDPVGLAIDDTVALPVACDLCLCVVEEQLHEEDDLRPS